MTDPGLPVFAGVRTAVEDNGNSVHHMECRFPDGQKYAPVVVDIECEALAQFIADSINQRVALQTERREMRALLLKARDASRMFGRSHPLACCCVVCDRAKQIEAEDAAGAL
jgi:hypothetical protein